MSSIKTLKITNIVHSILKDKINNDSVLVDATMGNGYDTLFLSKLIGDKGRIYSFDIQKKSLENTKQLLNKNQVNIENNNIKLILDGHENLDKYIKEKVDIVIYNLGYLPGSDKKVITRAVNTIPSIELALSLLNKGGIISIATYYGHLGGLDEKNALVKYTQNLDWATYTVMKCDYFNKEDMPVSLLFIEKKI